MATSEIMLEDIPYVNLETKGRKTGQTHNVELWFAYEDGKLYFLAHEDSHWWKNIETTSRVEVEASEILFEGTGRIVPGELNHVFELFRRKYGEDQIERWYGGSRAKRKAVEVVLGRVLGKRPSTRNALPEIAI
jgi:hypothetical protein